MEIIFFIAVCFLVCCGLDRGKTLVNYILEEQIMTSDEFQAFCLAQANWWCHSASNGHAATRHVTRGDGHRLTADELRDNAMKVSQQHLTNYMKSCDGEL